MDNGNGRNLVAAGVVESLKIETCYKVLRSQMLAALHCMPNFELKLRTKPLSLDKDSWLLERNKFFIGFNCS